MSLKDRIKAQAEQLAAKAQEGTAQAQAKFKDMQTKRGSDSLLRDLGVAYYAEQRQGGPHEAVAQALSALDAHAGENGPIDLSTTGPQAAPTQAAPSSGATPAGDFKLDDV